MPSEVLSTFEVGDTTVEYVIDCESGQVGLAMFPSDCSGERMPKRSGLAGLAYIDAMPGAGDPPATVVDPMIHVKLVGDWYPGAFAQGRTMRASGSNDRFRFTHQRVVEIDGKQVVSTTLQSVEGITLTHELSWFEGESVMEVMCKLANNSTETIQVEMITSFSIGGITPFDSTDGANRLSVHRFRSVWSAEGRLETHSIEELHLERSWSGAGAFSERFGQLGTMPVRGWFPMVAVTDGPAGRTGVTWGAQLAWAGTWQMEVFRQHDDLCISGGLGDREFGHWMKSVAPGEQFETPPATLACVAGGIDELCERLTVAHERAVQTQPRIEQDLPIIFNEWCTTWGDPSHEKVVAIADRLQGSPVKYLVIDAGWYKGEIGDWGNAHGDWMPSDKLFPQGLKVTADAIRSRGIVPGLWFEMETVGSASATWNMTDLLLKRDGVPITTRHRRFWDLTHPKAVAYLSEKVIGLLKSCGFGYLKVDYNETAGLGADGLESQGEKLRQHVEGVRAFFDKIRTELPELVIENCSSGGHRLEPSMLSRTAMSSFSDAHELVEIPLIAANLHRLILPRQNQIWAVLHGTDSDQRLVYSLAATFLGRMCLSGDVIGLNECQWERVKEAMALYEQAAEIIKSGKSRKFGEVGASWRYPTGTQAVVRTSADQNRMLVVVHAFGQASRSLSIPVGTSDWQISGAFPRDGRAEWAAGQLIIKPSGDFTAQVFLLTRK